MLRLGRAVEDEDVEVIIEEGMEKAGEAPRDIEATITRQAKRRALVDMYTFEL